jgi:hypothetical protein
VDDVLATLETGELLIRTGENVRLTDRGRLIADTIGTEIMTAFESVADTV